METKTIFDDIKYSDEGPMKKILVNKDENKVIRMCLKKGVQIPSHVKSHPVFFLVLKGKGIFTSKDGEKELGENQYISIDENEPRGIQALENLIILVVKF